MEANIYECLPTLRVMLNLSGLAKLIGKTPNWFNNKEQGVAPFERMEAGFTEDNIELLNYGLEKVVESCHKHRLQPPSECPNRDIYNKYVKTELKELRKLVSMVYLREKYTSIPQSSWNKKINNFANRGAVSQFTEADISEINSGIDAIADTLSNLKVVL